MNRQVWTPEDAPRRPSKRDAFDGARLGPLRILVLGHAPAHAGE